MNTEMILVSLIHLDENQPREIYDGIDELANSMRDVGFIPEQAINVTPHPEKEGEYKVIWGHRRTLAAKKAGLESVPAFIADYGTDPKMVYERQLIENENRRDLPPMNRVRAMKKGLDIGLSKGRVSKIYGISVKTLEADLVLLDLANDLHKFVDNGSLPKEVARKIASLESKQQQMNVFNDHVKGKSNSGAMLNAIQAYLDKQSQTNIFKEAAKQAAENGGLKKARKAFERLQKMVAQFEKEHYGDLNVINAHRRNLSEVKLAVSTMERVVKKIQEQVGAYEAQQDVNTPKEAA